MLLAVVMAVSLLPGTVWAADSDFTIGDGVFTKYNGPGGDVVIPDSIRKEDKKHGKTKRF